MLDHLSLVCTPRLLIALLALVFALAGLALLAAGLLGLTIIIVFIIIVFIIIIIIVHIFAFDNFGGLFQALRFESGLKSFYKFFCLRLSIDSDFVIGFGVNLRKVRLASGANDLRVLGGLRMLEILNVLLFSERSNLELGR